MSTQDKQGREYAKLADLKAGDIVTCDGDFDCMRPWSQLTVYEDQARRLCVECDHGGHTLTGQLDNGTHLVGIYSGTVAKV